MVRSRHWRRAHIKVELDPIALIGVAGSLTGQQVKILVPSSQLK